ncbi:Leu/Phe/Val dehydrogenase [Parendozoicomonas haliclonae]|uniref:Leucine dehydrogenase n=1 Tax=Parendozoicomonas haliclonae TaxID=1960125 RepID=A0A1X7APV7_9GAMM|nr:Glu/Leu/Phe/Val dehydrogenase dimerization domain-containing protein [Parendozoicomonas haliclonae]SMA50326.1 Leucine dehydrogenase [Parendozoicomonas haliclonae]
MFNEMKTSRTGELHFKSDPSTGLQAVIALHDLSRGPALGGCRLFTYSNTDAAIQDAIRLAQGMSYKAALAGIEQGGGKSVILAPKDMTNREQLFLEFGRFVDSLGGQYITAMDVGTQVADMDTMAKVTPHVSCTSQSGDPAPYTALGVFHSIKASLKACSDLSDSLADAHIAVQGLGHVGWNLCQLLHEAGARLTVTDIDAQKTQLATQRFGATVVSPEDIYSVVCDVFSPCGMGGVIKTDMVNQLRCRSVTGAANNQLANPEAGLALSRQGILYAPDYLVNAGGLIYASLSHSGKPISEINKRVQGIEQTLSHLYQRHNSSGEPTSLIADKMAEDILYGPDYQQRLSA